MYTTITSGSTNNIDVQTAVEFIANHEPIAAAVAAGLAAVVLYGAIGRDQLDADDDYWELVRRVVLPAVDDAVEDSDLYTAYELDKSEFVGTISLDVERVEEELERLGANRELAAALKTAPDGRVEAGSWVFRDLPENFDELSREVQVVVAALEDDQLHVILFRRSDGGTDVAVHHEANAINPLEGEAHYRGERYDVEKGHEEFREIWESAGLPLKDSNSARESLDVS